MRILFLTNFYPPVSRGGYEEWCAEVARGLRDRGHEVIVLTSRNGRDTLQHAEPAWILRDLHLEMAFASLRNSLEFFTRRKDRERENLARLRELMGASAFDVALVWGMWNLPRSLPAELERLMPGRVAYYMGDYWPTLPSQWQNYWDVPPRNWLTAAPKQLLKPIAHRQLASERRSALQLERVLFPTAFLRDEFARNGIAPRESTIVYGAIDTGVYANGRAHTATRSSSSLTLLYVGRLSEEKGVHTAIEALGLLAEQGLATRLKLVIAGRGEPAYEATLQDLARQNDLESAVTFVGAQPKEAMPDLYRQADVLLFTSIWPEPFGRVLVEAMASGTAVIGTQVGGAAEIIDDGCNALSFTPGDAASLAARIAQLAETPALRQQLVEMGRRTAVEQFDLYRMVGEIEIYLEQHLH